MFICFVLCLCQYLQIITVRFFITLDFSDYRLCTEIRKKIIIVNFNINAPFWPKDRLKCRMVENLN